eukprot:COSAG01_NODE_7260_length_3279_cov_1.910377_2_plen_155_part_00
MVVAATMRPWVGLMVTVPTVTLEEPPASAGGGGGVVAYYHLLTLLCTTGATITARRTHEDFAALRARLLSLKPGVGLPELPRRRLFAAMAARQDVMEERRSHYQRFLGSVVQVGGYMGRRGPGPPPLPACLPRSRSSSQQPSSSDRMMMSSWVR